MIFYYKEGWYKKEISNFSYRKLKNIEELLFLVYLIFETLYVINFADMIKEFIYTLNYIFVKYIYLFKDIQIFATPVYLENINKYLTIYFEVDNVKELYKDKNIYKQKIILCKRISKTREKGRIYRYKIMLIIFSTSYSWCGIGEAKDFFLQNAIYKARINAFRNIFLITLKNVKNIRSIIQKKKNSLFIIKSRKNILLSKLSSLDFVKESLKKMNVLIKKRNSDNIFKILNLIIKS